MSTSNDSKVRSWSLKRYAIYEYQPQVYGQTPVLTPCNDNWTWNCHVAEKQNDLTFLISHQHHLQVCKGDLLLENFSVLNSRSTVRAVLKGDSMLITVKLQSELRRFRIQLDGQGSVSGSDQCRHCASVLASYFPLRFSDNVKAGHHSESNDVSLDPSRLAQVILNKEQLSRAYETTATQLDNDQDLEELVYICLMDPTFPSFVSNVEKVLEKIMEE